MQYFPRLLSTLVLFLGLALGMTTAQAQEAGASENPFESMFRKPNGAGGPVGGVSGSTAPGGTVCTTKFCGAGMRAGSDLVEEQLDEFVAKTDDLKLLIIGWTNFILSIGAVMAVVAIVWAGFNYVIYFGDDGRVDTAKKIITWAAIGLIIILGAFAIVNTVISGILEGQSTLI